MTYLKDNEALGFNNVSSIIILEYYFEDLKILEFLKYFIF